MKNSVDLANATNIELPTIRILSFPRRIPGTYKIGKVTTGYHHGSAIMYGNFNLNTFRDRLMI